jgi:hypothetical protein
MSTYFLPIATIAQVRRLYLCIPARNLLNLFQFPWRKLSAHSTMLLRRAGLRTGVLLRGPRNRSRRHTVRDSLIPDYISCLPLAEIATKLNLIPPISEQMLHK